MELLVVEILKVEAIGFHGRAHMFLLHGELLQQDFMRTCKVVVVA